jgi:hypothetical protein
MRDKAKLLRRRLSYRFYYVADLLDMAAELVKYRADATSAVELETYLARRERAGVGRVYNPPF